MAIVLNGLKRDFFRVFPKRIGEIVSSVAGIMRRLKFSHLKKIFLCVSFKENVYPEACL